MARGRTPDASERDLAVRGRALGATEAGVVVDIDGMRGFVRRRELLWGARGDPSSRVGAELEGLILRIDESSGTIMLSPRALAVADAREAKGRRARVTGVVIRAKRDGLVLDVL